MIKNVVAISPFRTALQFPANCDPRDVDLEPKRDSVEDNPRTVFPMISLGL